MAASLKQVLAAPEYPDDAERSAQARLFNVVALAGLAALAVAVVIAVVVATADGRVLAGVFKGDDGKNLLLQTPEGFTLVIPKDQVEDQTRGASAMPEELTKSLTKAELRDLVEFLANQKGQGLDPQ